MVKINFVEQNIAFSEAMKKYVEKKIDKRKIEEDVTVTLKMTRKGKIKLSLQNKNARIEIEKNDFYECCDLATEKFNRMQHKRLEKIKSRKEKEIQKEKIKKKSLFKKEKEVAKKKNTEEENENESKEKEIKKEK